jgi:hypothetical protein
MAAFNYKVDTVFSVLTTKCNKQPRMAAFKYKVDTVFSVLTTKCNKQPRMAVFPKCDICMYSKMCIVVS